MNKKKKATLLICSICLFFTCFFLPQPTFATDTESSHITETNFFGNLRDDGSSCGVFTIVNFVVDTLSIGIGILALIGITIVGIKYLTAGGNEAQLQKAKKRMSQIVFGLVAYALLYVGAQWLLPGGKLDFGKRCTTVSNEELAQIKERERLAREEQRKKNEAEAAVINQRKKNKESSGQTSYGTSEASKKILQHAISVAKKVRGFSYSLTGANFTNKRMVYSTHTINCASYASLVMAEAGLLAMNSGRVASDNYGEFTILILGKYKKYWELIDNPHGSNNKQNPNSKTVSQLVKSGKLNPGDICGSASTIAHTFIYAGKKGNKYQFYEISSTGTQTYDNIINNYHDGSYKIGQCLHAK